MPRLIMKTSSRRIVATTALVSMALTSVGCTTTEQRLTAAAAATGTMTAGVDLPDLPAECRQKMPRVVPKDGEKWRWVQKRWEIVADGEDARVARCAAFYDQVDAGFGGKD